jgi:hypothetical protein
MGERWVVIACAALCATLSATPANAKDNTPHPGGPGAGTTQDLTYSFPIPCTATSDTTVGGDCTFETSAEAFAPGIVKELRRSVWALGSMRVYDGGGNLFMTQGIFVP